MRPFFLFEAVLVRDVASAVFFQLFVRGWIDVFLAKAASCQRKNIH